MGIYEIIIISVFGCTLIATIVYTRIYIYFKTPILANYVLYLFVCTLNFFILTFFSKEIISNDSALSSQVYSFLFIIEFIFYYFFISKAFNINKHTNYRLWLLITISYWFIGLQAIIIGFIRYYSNLQSVAYFTTVIIINSYILPISIYALFYCIKNAKNYFSKMILSGMISSFVFTYLSIIFQSVDMENHARNMIFGLSLFSIGIFLELIFFSIAMTLKIKDNFEEKNNSLKNIEYLNYANQLQIAMLEEKNNSIRVEEQKKMGMELHDNLAGTLASIRLQLESETYGIKDNNLQLKLHSITSQISNAYESIRYKSHKLVKEPLDDSEFLFSERILMLVQKILPDNKFKKNIEIDNNTFKYISLKTKIEMLKIIQEACINILKHAIANEICILIYSDFDGMIIFISDNGKGFDVFSKKDGIGLLSIKNRVTELNGSLNLKSDKKGTVLNITIPTKEH